MVAAIERGAMQQATERRFPLPPVASPGDEAAWFRPRVRTQYPVGRAVVTICADDTGPGVYTVRAPLGDEASLGVQDQVDRKRVGEPPERPLTREGVRRRWEARPAPSVRSAVAAATPGDRPARRRLIDTLHRRWWCWDALTELALDRSVTVVEVADDRRQVWLQHATAGPAVAVMDEGTPCVGRLTAREVAAYTVPFAGMPIEVRICTDEMQRAGPFRARYIAQEPPLSAEDRAVIRRCKRALWEVQIDGAPEERISRITDHIERMLQRAVTAHTGDPPQPPVAAAPSGDAGHRWSQYARCRYHILRDYVGEGPLTIPLRDPHLEDIEANRVGERIKVVPRADLGLADARVPTNLQFDDEARFSNLVRQLAAADGVELNASAPSAKVNISLEDHPDQETIRCAVALPTISAGGPHVSIRKQPAAPMTPMTLIDQGVIPPMLVAVLWLLLEHRGVVLFSGPTGVGKTTLLNAHMPFIPADQRPITIDEGSREVFLPHETGIALTTREHESRSKRVTMAELMTEANYLNPDVEVIAEVNTPASFRTFAEVLNTGHGVVGTTHADDIDALVNRVIEQGVPAYLLGEIDLVVFPKRVGAQRYVGAAVEVLDRDAHAALPDEARSGIVQKDGSRLYTNELVWRGADGAPRTAYDHQTGAGGPRTTDRRANRAMGVIDAIARRTDQPPPAVEAEFRSKLETVCALTDAGVGDMATLIEIIGTHRIDAATARERIDQLCA
jgi:type IV secretory pathway ATPase VirB11/archaellum biosynthesis ATPase